MLKSICSSLFVLILAAPGRAEPEAELQMAPAPTLRSSFSHSAPRLPVVEEPQRATLAAISEAQPSLH